ncbi:NADH-quinone oxidoreductase subunit A [Kamptonema cortianum]|nr:NADH-quinone oxidoreductase subunit A [Geitlerinema splendidum]MDK3158547.1 NADH-quinone oxidoreductase subunit A [Kamptonema cortianum]
MDMAQNLAATTPAFNEFIPILMLMGAAALVCTVMVVGSWVLGPKRITRYKSSPYECGVAPLGDAAERFPIKFYLVAILFVLFDIEVVFLWSWLTVFNAPGTSLDYQIFTGIAVLIYMVLWIIGDAYVLRVGAIDWDEATSLAPEKLDETKSFTSSEPTAEAS